MTGRLQRSRPRAKFRFLGGATPSRRSFTATTVIRLLTRSDVTLARLVTTIEGDPLFARRVRNSAKARSRSRFKVKNTRHAVSVMGFAELGRLAREYGRGVSRA